MLLYSTILKIVDTVTKEDFIDAVIEWNNSNPREENIIPNLERPHDERERFGSDNLWMEFLEYPDKNIIAVRYEKITEDGTAWDTDYTMNFDEMRLAIQLNRSYQEGVVYENDIFSTPLFISTLISHKYIVNDKKLPIKKRPISIIEDNMSILTGAVFGGIDHELPVVFVSKKWNNENPLNVDLLATRLKGVAHVFVQDDISLNERIRSEFEDKNEFNGAVGIYYPGANAKYKRFLFRDTPGYDEYMMDRIVSYIFSNRNIQFIEDLYTWQGVNNSLLLDRLTQQIEKRKEAEAERLKAKGEVEEVYSSFSEELEEIDAMREEIGKLNRENARLLNENAILAQNNSKKFGSPVLFRGDEDEVYPGEIKDFALSVLSDGLSGIKEGTRKWDVITDIINNNEFQKLAEEKRKELKKILNGYTMFSSKIEKDLNKMGFECTKDGKHCKLKYNGDSRYTIVLAKTPSDHRAGDNAVSNISNIVF